MGDTAKQIVMSVLNKIKYRRTLNKKSTVAKHGLAVVISLVMLGVILGVSWSFVYFKGSEYFSDLQSGNRIVVKAPITATPEAQASAPSDAPGETSVSPIAEEIADKIFTLESSRDKNDSCHAIGKHNGFGWRQNKQEWNCYNFTEEVRQYVIESFERRLQTYTLAQSLCLYNTGTASDDCPYYQKYLSLI